LVSLLHAQSGDLVYGDIVDLGNNQFSMEVSYFNGPNLSTFTPGFISVSIDVTGPVTLPSVTAPNNSGWTGSIINGNTALFSGGVNSFGWGDQSRSTNLLDNEFYPKVKSEKSGPGVANLAIDWLPETKLAAGQNDAKLLSANPLCDALNVSLNLLADQKVRSTIFDASGKRIAEQSDQVLSGTTFLKLTHMVHNIPRGIYYLELEGSAGVRKVFKLIK
jgi:hypothetical protein